MMPVSICMIVKNEEQKLARCLESIKPLGFDLVVVDTGSTDSTKEIAAQYGARVFSFPWCNDFSAARNFSLSKAAYPWIFMIDSDEWLESIDLEELQYFMDHLSYACGSITRKNLVGSKDAPGHTIDHTERFFHRDFYFYTGAIHEQLTPKPGHSFETLLLNLSIGHDGYCMTEEEALAKANRNLSLLCEWQQKEPDNPYVYYQLGKGYDIVCDYEKACFYYARGLEFPLDCSLAYVLAMVVSYGKDLLSLNRVEDALLFEAIYEDFSYSADFVYLMGLIYEKAGELTKAAAEFQKAITFDFANEEGVNGELAHAHLRHVLEQLQTN